MLVRLRAHDEAAKTVRADAPPPLSFVLAAGRGPTLCAAQPSDQSPSRLFYQRIIGLSKAHDYHDRLLCVP
jgi:hypothetical protein